MGRVYSYPDEVAREWKRERDELLEALKFYSDERNWNIPKVDPITGFEGNSSKSIIEHDRGKLARVVCKRVIS